MAYGQFYPGTVLVEAPTFFDTAAVVTHAGAVNFTGAVTNTGPLTQSGTTTFTGPGTYSGTSNFTGPVAGTTTFTGQVNITGDISAAEFTGAQPENIALKAWNVPTTQMGGTATVTIGGTVYGASVNLVAGVTYSTMYINVVAAGGTFTAGSNFAGLYNPAGSLVATTADLTAALGTGTTIPGYRPLPLATAYTPATSGPHYTGIFFNTSAVGSFPVLVGLSQQAVANSVTTLAGTMNGPIGTTPSLWWAAATTSATQMPASFTLTNMGTTGAQCYWVGLA